MSPILDLELPASPTSDGETRHHLEDSGQGDSLLITCMSQRWHNGCYLRSESDEDSDGDDRDVEGSGKAPNVPFEDGPNNDELDVFDWDALNQEYGPTLRDELGESFESRYTMIGVLYLVYPRELIALTILSFS